MITLSLPEITTSSITKRNMANTETCEDYTAAALEAQRIGFAGDFFAMQEIGGFVMDRLAIVRTNMHKTRTLAILRRDIRENYPRPGQIKLQRRALDIMIENLDIQVDNGPNALMFNPATAVGRALCRMDDLAQLYTRRIPEMFKGCSPVPYPDGWAAQFATKDFEIGTYEQETELDIAFALVQAAQGVPRFDSIEDLRTARQQAPLAEAA